MDSARDARFGQPTGGGGQNGYPDPTSGHTGANVYGYNLAGDYANNMPVYALTTDALNCRDLSNEPAQVVKLVAQFQQHATPKVLARTDSLAIVSPKAPFP